MKRVIIPMRVVFASNKSTEEFWNIVKFGAYYDGMDTEYCFPDVYRNFSPNNHSESLQKLNI